MSVPTTFTGKHAGCGGAVVFRPVTYRRELLAGQAVTLTAVCRQCGAPLSMRYSLGSSAAPLASEPAGEWTGHVAQPPELAHEQPLALVAGGENLSLPSLQYGPTASGAPHRGGAQGVPRPPGRGGADTRGGSDRGTNVTALADYRTRTRYERKSIIEPARPHASATPAHDRPGQVATRPTIAPARAPGAGHEAYMRDFAQRFAAAHKAVARARDELPAVLAGEGKWSTPTFTPRTPMGASPLAHQHPQADAQAPPAEPLLAHPEGEGDDPQHQNQPDGQPEAQAQQLAPPAMPVALPPPVDIALAAPPPPMPEAVALAVPTGAPVAILPPPTGPAALPPPAGPAVFPQLLTAPLEPVSAPARGFDWEDDDDGDGSRRGRKQGKGRGGSRARPDADMPPISSFAEPIDAQRSPERRLQVAQLLLVVCLVAAIGFMTFKIATRMLGDEPAPASAPVTAPQPGAAAGTDGLAPASDSTAPGATGSQGNGNAPVEKRLNDTKPPADSKVRVSGDATADPFVQP